MNTGNNTEVCTNTSKCYDFSSLPPHVIAHILSYLNLYDFRSAALTCRSWNTGSRDPHFGYRFVININKRTRIEENYLVRPLKCIAFNSVDIDRCDIRKLIRNHGHQIMYVLFSRCQLRLTQLFRAIYYMPNLKELNIYYGKRYYRVDNNYNSFKAKKKRYSKIMENLGGIKLLEITTEKETILPGIVILLDACKHLEELIWNKNGIAYGPNEFIFTSLLDSTSHCIPNTVRRLRINRIDPNQSQRFFEKFLNLELPFLTQLNLEEISSQYYDNTFRYFCKKFHTLQSLQIQGCNQLQLSDICCYITKLKSLLLSNLDVTNLIEIKNLKYLENLSLKHSSDVPVDSLSELFNTKFEYLIKLNLDYVNANTLNLICANVQNLQWVVLKLMSTLDCTPIFKNLIKLKALSIVFENISNIPTDEIISDEVFNITRLTELGYLYVTCYVPGITPTLIKKLPRLSAFQPPFDLEI